jgi:hypothetical protein
MIDLVRLLNASDPAPEKGNAAEDTGRRINKEPKRRSNIVHVVPNVRAVT